MTKLKKVVIAILCLTMLTVMLSACGGGSSSSSKKYGYVTNSDGSRTWYDTSKSNIVRID